MASPALDPIVSHLKSLYTAYRQTTSIPEKGTFFSTECMQICRPQPSYAAKNRETIFQYLHDAVKAGTNLATSGQSDGEIPQNAGDFKRCTIRPVRREDEFEFGSNEIAQAVGYSADELRKKAEKEGWRGMRVDLWADNGMGMDTLVKVRYWWRKEKKADRGENKEKEDDEWMQILHDIMYVGARDGTEGYDGELLL